MAGSTFGKLFRLTTFGESHGEGIGGIIDGIPPNFPLNIEFIQNELNRRKPGQSSIVTARKEGDKVRIMSGVFEGKTTGTPIGFVIENSSQNPSDYNHLSGVYRPSHADYSYQKKYGIRDYRGGGRSSARETACRIVAGAVAKQILKNLGVNFSTYVDQIGEFRIPERKFYAFDQIESNLVRCPNLEVANEMINYIEEIKIQGDSIGGCISCFVNGVPAGIGEPVFDKLNAELAKAVFSINAVKGFEVGSGFLSASMKGSAHNDHFNPDGSTKTNYSGGIQGGISNGMPIEMRVAFKPVSSIQMDQDLLTQNGDLVNNRINGRHDPCVLPRAVPIVEAMVAIVILDLYLQQKALIFEQFIKE
jgi:chorismate synthase